MVGRVRGLILISDLSSGNPFSYKHVKKKTFIIFLFNDITLRSFWSQAIKTKRFITTPLSPVQNLFSGFD